MEEDMLEEENEGKTDALPKQSQVFQQQARKTRRRSPRSSTEDAYHFLTHANEVFYTTNALVLVKHNREDIQKPRRVKHTRENTQNQAIDITYFPSLFKSSIIFIKFSNNNM